MSEANILRTKRKVDGTVVQVRPDGSEVPLVERTDWARLHAMTDAEVEAAAVADPDAPPLVPENAARFARVPAPRTLRRALGLTQEQFAARFHIPIGTLRDWEQGRVAPDQTARAYLRAIAGNPQAVAEAVNAHPALNGD